jgi:hypothetical protein
MESRAPTQTKASTLSLMLHYSTPQPFAHRYCAAVGPLPFRKSRPDVPELSWLVEEDLDLLSVEFSEWPLQLEHMLWNS